MFDHERSQGGQSKKGDACHREAKKGLTEDLFIKDLNKGRDRAMGIFNRRAKSMHFIPAWFVKISPSADQHDHLKEHFRDRF